MIQNSLSLSDIDREVCPESEDPAWVKPMKAVHSGFMGQGGYVAQLGDSITYSSAFWSCLQNKAPWEHLPNDGMPKHPQGNKWEYLVSGCGDKGQRHGNFSGWRIDNLLKVIDTILIEKKPEVALLMIGTNDVKAGQVPAHYQAGVEVVIGKLMDAKCIPIMSTIPPMRDNKESVDTANAIIKALVHEFNAPWVDYHHEITCFRPSDWDGTLISNDGIHPSGGEVDDFSSENLRLSGYALRTYLSFLKYREVYFKVIAQ